MGVEIERKFLVKDSSYRQIAKGVYYKQGYLNSNSSNTIRVRIIEQKAYITIKSMTKGISRLEYEYEIPFADASEIIDKLCNKPIIEKYRFKIQYEGFTWEVDEFLGDNAGLIMAEIELPNEDTLFAKPAFVGDDVSADERFYNCNLVVNPFKNWSDEFLKHDHA